MEESNISCSEKLNPSLIAISTNSSLPVDYVTTSCTNSNPTCARSSQRIDAYIKGLIKCESCSKVFTTCGEYKYVSLFFLEPSFELTASILAAITKPIPDHTVATPAAKGLA